MYLQIANDTGLSDCAFFADGLQEDEADRWEGEERAHFDAHG